MERIEIVTVSNSNQAGNCDTAEVIGAKYGEVLPWGYGLEIRVPESKRNALVAELNAAGYDIIEGE